MGISLHIYIISKNNITKLIRVKINLGNIRIEKIFSTNNGNWIQFLEKTKDINAIWPRIVYKNTASNGKNQKQQQHASGRVLEASKSEFIFW